MLSPHAPTVAGRRARSAVRALLLALSVAVGAPAAAAQAPRDPAVGRVVVDSLWSPALGVAKRFLVWLPPGYDAEPTRRWPVAYWLHGLGGDETNWVRQGRLDRAADSLARAGRGAALLVMPDGDDGWYTTWNALGDLARCRADTARAEPAATRCVPWLRYDDYVARDLVARVDSAYRTLPTRSARAVAGLSMGGYGAVTLALRYPDVWSAAVSHSGVLAPRPGEARPEAAWGSQRRAFGPDTAGWWARDPARLAARLVAADRARLPALHVDVGTSDRLLAQSRAFRRALDSLGVPVAYAEWPGGHTWDYWRAHAPEGLAWLLARLDGARPTPARPAASSDRRRR